MATNTQYRWAVRLATLLLWLLAAGSCVYWGLRLASRPAPAAVAPAPRQTFAADPAAIAKLLGASSVTASVAAQPAASLASRFSLVGVVASRSNTGAALIAVDGKPARPYRVGTPIDEGLVLQSVQGRKAVIASATSGPPVLTLELPPPKR